MTLSTSFGLMLNTVCCRARVSGGETTPRKHLIGGYRVAVQENQISNEQRIRHRPSAVVMHRLSPPDRALSLRCGPRRDGEISERQHPLAARGTQKHGILRLLQATHQDRRQLVETCSVSFGRLFCDIRAVALPGQGVGEKMF